MFTWIGYHNFVQYGFILEAYKLNSWLELSEKIVALLQPSTHTRSVFTWIGYHHFVQYGFVLEAYKLNSWLGLSEKMVALFQPSTVCYFYPLILLSDDGELVRLLLYAGMLCVLKGGLGV